MQRGFPGVVAPVILISVLAQPPRSLDDRIDRFNIPHTLPLCGIGEPLMRLAQTAHILIGSESKTGCSQNPIGVPAVKGPEDRSDVTARKILTDLVALDTAYQWRDMDGIAVIRPATAWNDRADPLNFSTSAFVLTDGRLIDGVRGVLRQPSNSSESIHAAGPLMNLRFSMTFSGGTILDALNATIRAHQSAWWQASVLGSGSQRRLGLLMFGVPGFHHFAIETEVSSLRAR